jgi:hypothetical protein
VGGLFLQATLKSNFTLDGSCALSLCQSSDVALPSRY